MDTPTISYNLDDATNFEDCMTEVAGDATSNFLVAFDNTAASCTVNVTCDTIDAWLRSSAVNTNTRWLHFWAEPSQRQIVDKIVRHYGLSPRLVDFVCPIRARSGLKRKTLDVSVSQDGAREAYESGLDIEKNSFGSSSRNDTTNTATDPEENLKVFDIVRDMWHFCSLEHGKRYLYVGVNMLFQPRSHVYHTRSSTPNGKRYWTSFLLCDDATVITVFERPEVSIEEQHMTRKHVVDICRNLSRFGQTQNREDLDFTNVRRLTDSIDTEHQNPHEMAGLLFYYLFDDWKATFAWVTGRQHFYRDLIAKERAELTYKANVQVVENLHGLGQQLEILRLMYRSYELIIARILHHYSHGTQDALPRPNSSYESGSSALLPSSGAMGSAIEQSEVMFDKHGSRWDSSATVILYPSTLRRFERMLDRIRLYALTEIDLCLREKETLVLMAMNFVSLKESQAIERLTRTTILLAKATILFLPVSLATAYFSIQIGDLQNRYTLKTYWVTFVIVILCSILVLVGFGVTTNTIEGKIVYQSIWRTALAAAKKMSKLA